MLTLEDLVTPYFHLALPPTLYVGHDLQRPAEWSKYAFDNLESRSALLKFAQIKLTPLNSASLKSTPLKSTQRKSLSPVAYRLSRSSASIVLLIRSTLMHSISRTLF